MTVRFARVFATLCERVDSRRHVRVLSGLRRWLITKLASNSAVMVNVNIKQGEQSIVEPAGSYVDSDNFMMKRVLALRLELPKGAEFWTINSTLNDGRFERIESKIKQYRKDIS